MKDQTEQKRPWVVVLAQAQISNKAAEAMGKGPWWLFIVTVLLTSVLTAFPLANDNALYAFRSANPALYPGLYQVFDEIKQQRWELWVEKGFLKTGPTVPAQVRVGSWLVVFEPAGGNADVLKDAVGSSGTTIQKIAFFGSTHLGLLDQTTTSQFDGSWLTLGWFRTSQVMTVPTGQLINLVLHQTATARLPQVTLLTELIMFVQVVLLVMVLGFLLSLSKVQIAGTTLGARRAVGFVASLKTTAFVALGPALLCALVLSFIPGASGIAWVVFSLLFGGRIVLIYMGRFRNKVKA